MLDLQSNEHTEKKDYSKRIAVLLNANARSVDEKIRKKAQEFIKKEDLFFSHSIEEAEQFAKEIVRRGYEKVFTGGGDGTITHALNAIRARAKELNLPTPQFGVLKLGTGNALARFLETRKASKDLKRLSKGEVQSVTPLYFVKTNDEQLAEQNKAPFMSLGYDGIVLNAYDDLRTISKNNIWDRIYASPLGYLFAFFYALPKLMAKRPNVQVKTLGTAYKIPSPYRGELEEIAAGTVIYEGPAKWIALGSIPFYGFGFKIFPFANKKDGFVQLRCINTPLRKILPRAMTGIRKGTYRPASTPDFLIEHIEVVSEKPLAFQTGGDAAGHRERIEFSSTKTPMEMVKL